MSDEIQIVEIIIPSSPSIIEVATGIPGPQGIAGPDPWLEPIQDLTADGNGVDIDYSAGKHVRLTVTANDQISVANWPDADRIARLTLEIHCTGAFSLDWPAEVKWPAGVAPELTPDEVDVIILTTTTSGSVVYGFPAGIDMR